ncbi:UNVERIFIED_CONTAM: hypothetical protein GTU68_054849 [Idotea baltica]|nr:hypothetical protein [Idotea baltica]
MRSIASNAKLDVELSDSSVAIQLGVCAPVVDSPAVNMQQAVMRGLGDTIAMLGAHHDEQLHRQCMPAGMHEQRLFNELERTRCEALGANTYKGVAKNLAWLQAQSHSRSELKSYSGIDQLSLVLGCLTHEALTGEPTQAALSALVNFWRANIETRLSGGFGQLARVQADQAKFSELSLQMIQTLDIDSLVAKSNNEDSTNASPVDVEEGDSEGDSEEESTQSDAPDQEQEAMMEQAAAEAMKEELEREEEAIQTAADDADNRAPQPNKDTSVESPAESNGDVTMAGVAGYTVFSSEFDEVVHASDLSDDVELTQLRDKLDQQIERHSSLVGRLSGRLQRLLMAQQRRHWIFDLDEGHLDTSRLTRVVTQPLSALSFKAESELKFKDTSITLLLDNSKSMLGKPITIAASCADLLAQTLERCGISVEILGFTTTELHGGKSVAQWQESGASADPGRLNGLRHIIYKAADTPYRTARKSLGLMLRGDILKQNIDGEALMWAHSRIVNRPEQRKIIMMISDGEPIDTSTMSANPQNYLVEHLHTVIGDIKRNGRVELVAIGIGHDVSVYYDRSITIYDVKKLGRAMLTQLDDLFRDSSGNGP